MTLIASVSLVGKLIGIGALVQRGCLFKNVLSGVRALSQTIMVCPPCHVAMHVLYNNKWIKFDCSFKLFISINHNVKKIDSFVH